MSISPDALAATLSRTIGLSNDRRQTLVVLIQGLINARTVNLSHLAAHFADRRRCLQLPSPAALLPICAAGRGLAGQGAGGAIGA